MAYQCGYTDINGAWASETGPNAPFQHEENKGASYSFVKSMFFLSHFFSHGLYKKHASTHIPCLINLAPLI